MAMFTALLTMVTAASVRGLTRSPHLTVRCGAHENRNPGDLASLTEARDQVRCDHVDVALTFHNLLYILQDLNPACHRTLKQHLASPSSICGHRPNHDTHYTF